MVCRQAPASAGTTGSAMAMAGRQGQVLACRPGSETVTADREGPASDCRPGPETGCKQGPGSACRMVLAMGCRQEQVMGCRQGPDPACKPGRERAYMWADRRVLSWWRDTGAASRVTGTLAPCCNPARSLASASRRRDCHSSDRQRPGKRAPWSRVCRWASGSSSGCKRAADRREWSVDMRVSWWCSGCKRGKEAHTRGWWACRQASWWCWVRTREMASRPAPGWSAEASVAVRREWCWAWCSAGRWRRARRTRRRE